MCSLLLTLQHTNLVANGVSPVFSQFFKLEQTPSVFERTIFSLFGFVRSGLLNRANNGSEEMFLKCYLQRDATVTASW